MKTRLLLFFILVGTANLFGQIGFNENIVISADYTTYSPQFVRAVDVDGDNDLDVVTYGEQLNWYENVDGLGNFGQKKIIAGALNGSRGTSLYMVDFDNDGDLDILNSANNKFNTYKNTDGLGHFQMVVNLTVGINSSSSMSVLPTDVDNDGDQDILCFYPTSSSRFLVWYSNNGDGTFGTEQIITSNDALLAATLFYMADLDGDNDNDIIVGNKSYSKILWIKNNGDGTYGAPVTISTLADGITSIATSDIDNDGDMDIVSASTYDNQVVWYKNLDGLGTFSDENVIISNATASNAVLAANINNDNTNDIIYTSTNEIGWMSNDGLGNFGPQQVITNKAYGVRSVIMADIDGDGINDLLSASQEDDKVAWYKHDGNGNFERQLPIARSINYPNKVYPGDFDGDNDIDLLISSQHDAKLAWFENTNGQGFYGKQHIITENVEVGNITPAAYPVDLDGDGDLDVVVCQESVLLWYDNVDGKGNFITHIIDNTSTGTTQIRSKDMDGDGAMDVVCGVYNSDKISWYKNLGDGTFGTEIIIAPADGTNGSLTSLEIADMDGDNDMDIIVSSFNGYTHYYKNTDGLGNFVLQYNEELDRMMAVYPADIDGDGDQDIIGVSSLGGDTFEAVVWYENTDGLGNFSIQHDISTLEIRGKSIYAADIDHDGDMDVLTTSGSYQGASGQLAWYENDGHGVFSAKQLIHETFDNIQGLCVATADIDNDNDLDVLAVFGYNANWTIGKVSIFENLGALGNTIQGKVLIDTDANGCTDADIKGSNLLIISDNGSHSFATFTAENGTYTMPTDAGNFTTAITSQLPDYFVATPASYAFNFSGLGNTNTADFCVAPVGMINDLDVSVFPLNTLRPGFEANYRVVYRNNGTVISNGSINFEYNNNKLNFVNANPVVASQTTNALTFDFTNLNLFETRTIDLHFSVMSPPTTNINDVIVSTVTANPIAGDATEENNSHILNQTVIGSYDPNDITCLEGNQVLITDADKYLHYVIRFQNTGTASAINVKVENTLDNKLDWSTMQLESMSHNGRVAINDGRDVTFIFNNINLPDSTTDEPNSHGFITYKIKPMNNVVVGNIVNNTAEIFFDFNPPIVTNTTATRFVNTLAVAENDINSFKIYPNPTNDVLNIQGNTLIDNVTLIDINGRTLKEYHFNTPTAFAQLDVTTIANGIYFLKIKSKEGSSNVKIIKR